MAHAQQLNFLKDILEIFPSNEVVKVLDLGSLDINGGIRSFMPDNWEYTGVDLDLGPNVDIACPAQLLELRTGIFDLVISSELFEHTPFWKETFAQMCRLTKEGGVVTFTCAGVGRMEHGTTRSDGGFSSPFTVLRGDEYYRNVPRKEALKAVALRHWFSSFSFFDQTASKDLYFVGLRRQAEKEIPKSFSELLNNFTRNYPVKKYKIRYWTLKFLPFAITDNGLRFLWIFKSKLKLIAEHPLYRFYVKSGIRKFKHMLAAKLIR